jgi:hypothetical protein
MTMPLNAVDKQKYYNIRLLGCDATVSGRYVPVVQGKSAQIFQKISQLFQNSRCQKDDMK